MVAFSSLALALTAPGQTIGVSVMIDPLIADLGIGRTQISTAYLIGTLTGACAMPLVGRAIDRHGPRAVMAAVGAAFGAVLIALSFVTGIAGLTAGFVGIRMTGQGALSLVATTTVAYWFDRRRGLALGIVGAVGSAGISTAPILTERLIAATSWQQAWLIQGLVVWAVVIPLALFGLRNRPADLGQHVDGVPPAHGEESSGGLTGWTLRPALRTGMFWVIVACLSASSMLATGLAFHQIDLLGERGLSTAQAAANFLPQTAAVLLVTIASGALLDRFSPRFVMTGSVLTLAAAVIAAALVDSAWTALAYGIILGTSGGMIRAVDSAAMPRYFGTAHLGAIRGISHTAVIAASALGPLAVSLGRDLTGSYAGVLPWLAAIPLLIAVAAATVPEPPPTPADQGESPASPETTGSPGSP